MKCKDCGTNLDVYGKVVKTKVRFDSVKDGFKWLISIKCARCSEINFIEEG